MSKPTTIDAYLAAVTPEHRAALEAVRAVIRDAVPDAEECISYSLPAFRWKKKVLIGFGAAGSHCALYLFSGSTVTAQAELLRGYDVSKGTVRFQADAPLPDSLIRALVSARQAEVLGV